MRSWRSIGWALGLLVTVLAGSPVWAGSNIDPANRCAWAENAGWINFAPTNGGVMAAPTGLSGYAWAENIGWIKLAALNSTYENTAANNWGVKLVGSKLKGYAWSENAGWINFAATNSPGVTVDSDGWFSGYAWGESVGWVHFRNTSAPYGVYGVRTTASLRSGMVLMIQ